MSDPATRATLAASDAVVGWCLRNAVRMEHGGDASRAALWGYVAAEVATDYGHSYLRSQPLEALLQRIGAKLATTIPSIETVDDAASHPRRWLHVFSMTLAIGGHTALARRWIVNDRSGDRHMLVVTMQSADRVDTGIASAVTAAGGSVVSIAGEGGLLRRAARLRQLAMDSADVVVLHAHTWDVVPSLAFAASGGPPVLLLNHADHAFWVGGSVADIVIDIRDSGLALSQRFRGVRRSVVLPVPLEDPGLARLDRSRVASELGDPTLLTAGGLLLTIGSGHKYRSVPGLDFAATLLRIVEAVPECVVIAVGPKGDDPLWQSLRQRSEGRVRAVGPDPELRKWHSAADLYLEGFPVGSYTALLEVALAGRAIVRKPWLAPPDELPVDRGGLAAFEPPATPDDYVLHAMRLARDPMKRSQDAMTARADVLATHCGEGWLSRLDNLRGALPRVHEPVAAGESPALTQGLSDYWARFHAAQPREGPLEVAIRAAQAQGLHPRTDIAVRDALRDTAAPRHTDKSL